MIRSRSQQCGRGRTALLCLTTSLSLLLNGFVLVGFASAGPYTDTGHGVGAMNAWATSVDSVIRGPQDIAAPSGAFASAGTPTNLLGEASGTTLSLGDGGSATLYFDSGISNGPGDDLAVFENGFLDAFGLFAEFAFVEVGSNGVDFARFETDTVRHTSVDPFESLDPTDYHGFAGRHEAFFGTGFDLADLAFDPLVQSGAVDLIDIRYVRVIDAIGDGSTFTTAGDSVYDPYATPFAVGGFDLDAIGVIHVPEPSALLGLAAGLIGLAVLGGPRNRRRRLGLTGLLASIFVAGPAFALIATFDDLGLGVEDHENGAGLSGGYTSGGVFFENSYFPSYDGFSGFAASTKTDTTTPGFLNQYSAIPGGGADGSEGYGIYFAGGNVVLPSTQIVLGADFTNTTYAYLSIRDGDFVATPFGGGDGTEPDFFRLLIEGLDASGVSTGVVEFMLADFRNPDDLLDYIVDDWSFVDLSGLGPVKELAFSFESSDVGEFGINTPTYFAIDNLTTIPEPGTALLLGLGLAGLSRRGRER